MSSSSKDKDKKDTGNDIDPGPVNDKYPLQL